MLDKQKETTKKLDQIITIMPLHQLVIKTAVDTLAAIRDDKRSNEASVVMATSALKTISDIANQIEQIAKG